jgi:hypothetical protein
MMWKVKTDEEFFNKFNEIKNRLDQMAMVFQNEGAELSAVELGNWNMIVNETKQEFNKLIKEANKRIERVEIS